MFLRRTAGAAENLRKPWLRAARGPTVSPGMLHGKPRELKTRLAAGDRLLGLDVGTKTVGLALSDTTLTVASPYATLRRTRFTADAQALAEIIAREGVGGLIIGLPINMDGTEGRRCQSIRAFATNFLKTVDIPTAFWDERLSTAAVTRTLLEADASRRRRRQLVDKLAAAYILQGALDSLAAK